MDPTACWKRALDAIESGDRDETVDACEDLAAWLRRKGAMPAIATYELEFLLQWVANTVRSDLK